MLNPGIKGSASVAVTAANTAAAMGSGELNVFATPALAALVEKACWQSVAPELDPGCGTVGTPAKLAAPPTSALSSRTKSSRRKPTPKRPPNNHSGNSKHSFPTAPPAFYGWGCCFAQGLVRNAFLPSKSACFSAFTGRFGASAHSGKKCGCPPIQ